MDTHRRLRLHIRRHGLPELRVVFPAALKAHSSSRYANENTTVAHLLDQINQTVPLEATHWALEDYCVELMTPSGPFECLHYEHVATLFDKDDEVIIRPLCFDDRRRRRLCGRDQIAPNGSHLTDGVPFGRTRLQHEIRRPEVRIAPDDDGGEDDEEMDDGEEDNYGLDFDHGSALPDDEQQLLLEDRDTYKNRLNIGASKEEEEDEDDDDYNDDDYDDDDDDDFEDSSSNSGSDSESDNEKVAKQARDSNDKDEGDEDDEDFKDESSDSSSHVDSESDIPIHAAGSTPKPPTPVEIGFHKQPESVAKLRPAPGTGRKATQRRNARRRAKIAYDQAQLHTSQSSAALGADSTTPAALATPSATTDVPGPPTTAQASSVHRHLKLDMDAGRRMIFSVLGIKNGAAAGVKSQPASQPGTSATASLSRTADDSSAVVAAAAEDTEMPKWSDVISYSAVECSDNTLLDKPSFPFIQQWHNTPNKGTPTNKRKAGNQPDARSPKKRTQGVRETMDDNSSSISSSSDSSDDSSDGSSDGSSDDSSDDNSEELSAATAAVAHSANDTPGAVDDLPPVPDNWEAMPKIDGALDTLRPGTVFAYKRLMMSEATNWQPEMLTITAKLNSIVKAEDGGEGDLLDVTLAERDRHYDRPPRQYDGETGERVYGRFELPGDEEEEGEDEGEDDGRRSLLFGELIDPRLI